jgi:Fur family transcriptional regulator, ferric uptake regulator
MKRASSLAARAVLRSKISSVGLRSTAPRVAVLEHLQSATTPLSHGEIFDALVDQGFDRATIYRNLADLTEAELLSRTDVGDHVWRFEQRRDGPRGAAPEHPISCVSIAGKCPASQESVSASPRLLACRAPSSPRALSCNSKGSVTAARHKALPSPRLFPSCISDLPVWVRLPSCRGG